MRKHLKARAFLTLILALLITHSAFASSSEPLQAVYDALMADSSSFQQLRDIYALYFEGAKLDAQLQDNSIIITLDSANEWMDSGEWTFTQDGEDLTATFAQEDYGGVTMVMTVFEAIADSHGVNSSLLNGYIAGLGEENPYLSVTAEESTETVTYSVQLNASYDFEGIEKMIMTEDTVYFLDALDEEYVSRGGNYGKVILVMNGNVHSLTILVCEYGALDDVAYQDIVNAVSASKPDGWETFLAEYTQLEDAQGDTYSVVLNPDDTLVGEIIDERYEGYSYAIVRLGQDE